LGRLVAEMQAQMEDLAWENTALEDRLRAALRQQEAVEAVLDEHEDALARIHVLETQVHIQHTIV
jgi:chaperonin cofactor prefoldin